MCLGRIKNIHMKTETVSVPQLEGTLMRNRATISCWGKRRYCPRYCPKQNGQYFKSEVPSSFCLHFVSFIPQQGLLSEGLSRDRVGILLMAGCGFSVVEDSSFHCIYRKRRSVSGACPHPNTVTAHTDKNEIQTSLCPQASSNLLQFSRSAVVCNIAILHIIWTDYLRKLNL